MLNFKPIELRDKKIIQSYTGIHACRDCNWSFANLIAWQFKTRSCYAFYKDRLIVRFEWGEKAPCYMICFDHGDLTEVVRVIEQEAEERNEELCIHGAFPHMENAVNAAFPGKFEFINKRNYADYIYNRHDLVELKGKNYQPKRNHVNKFVKTYPYEYVELREEDLDLCRDMERKWYERNGLEQEESVINERKALEYMLTHYGELELIGGSLRVDGKMVAFSIGSQITEDTIDIHMEKADIDYSGSYAAINKEFVSRLPEKYIYVNREEDLGISGLRKDKLSYYPVLLLEKGRAVKKSR